MRLTLIFATIALGSAPSFAALRAGTANADITPPAASPSGATRTA